MRGSLFVGCAAALATVALVLALVSQGQHPRRTVLTFADGTVSDVPDLVSEADTNVEDGVAPLDGDHVGYWERPGNDNNQAYADLAGAKMDRRMRSDAAGAQFWQTKGTDFFDTDALYSPFTDGDDTLSSGWGSQYDNTFPGTGEGLYGYDDLGKQNDAYDGGFPIRANEAEAADSAYVSGTDFAGYRADPAQLRRVVGGAQLRQAVGGAQLRQVGGGARRGARMTQLWNAATNDEVSLQNLGGRHRWDMSKKEKAFYAPVLDKDHNRKYHPEIKRTHAEVTDAREMDFHPQKWLAEQSGM